MSELATADVAEVVERELDLLSELPFVESEAQLEQLLPIARHAEFHDGEHLFDRGAAIDRIYLVIDGVVELVKGGAPSWRIVGSGGVGFLDFMQERPHTRTAIARGEVRVLEIDAADYREYLQDHVDFASEGLSRLSADLFDAILASGAPGRLLARPTDAGAGAHDVGDTLVDRLLLLTRVPAFARASVQALANLAQRARTVRHAAGREIVTAGVRSESISVLVRGEVELLHVGATPIAPIRRGAVDLLSDLAELATVPRRVSVRAVTDAVVLRIEREDLLDRMDEHYEVVQSLYAYVARQRERLNNVAAAAGHEI